MCGLLGFIGTSKDPVKSQELMTALFAKTQERGLDAAGFYCVSDYGQNKIYYHKQPGPSTKLIKEKIYQDLWQNKLNLGLFHCRAASSGVGVPAENINNHPFVSQNLRKAVIHNGLIIRNEYNHFKRYYETESDCDSEIILRVLEQDDNSIIDNLSKFITYVPDSHYAVAYSEVEKESRKLFLFRNKQRPLFIANLIDELGQVIFFSTLEIFLDVLDKLIEKNIFINFDKIIELKPNEVYEIYYQKNNEIQMNLYESIASETDAEIGKNYYGLRNNEEKIFNIDKIDKDYLIEDEFLESISELNKNQKELENKILNLLQLKKISKDKCLETINSIKELNKSIDYINNNIKG